MNRWLMCILMGLTLTACGQGGGSGAPQKVSIFACDVRAMEARKLAIEDGIQVSSAAPVENSSSFATEPQDPFADQKVVLNGGTTAGIGIQSNSDARLIAAGTEISVTLDQSCEAGGQISTAVRNVEAAAQRPLPTQGVHSFTYLLPADVTTDQLKEAAAADSCVVGISDSFKSYVSALPTDPRVNEQGHLAMLDMAAGYDVIANVGFTKKPVIAVIDTGIDLKHPDLKNILWRNRDEIPGNNIDDDHNGYVDDVNGFNFAQGIASPGHSGTWGGFQHGTHVSGLAAAQAGNGVGIAGIAGSRAEIMALNVFGKEPGAYSSDIANAIRYAADNGANVINLSVGGVGRSAAYESALAYAVKRGVAIFAASGNEHREVGKDYFMSPGAYGPQFGGMMAVGSVDSSNLALSSFSNYSSLYVELSAPGSENSRARNGLLSTWPGERYARIQGTSMSSPVAAGAAALAYQMLWARGYQPSAATIEGILAMSARQMNHLRSKIRMGRMLNLKSLSQYITLTYPVSQAGGDPGVPGYQPCEM